MKAAEYQRQRRARLKADGTRHRLQVELSTRAILSLDHLAAVRGQTTRATLEHLILQGVNHATS